jgi:hypothetical protein
MQHRQLGVASEAFRSMTGPATALRATGHTTVGCRQRQSRTSFHKAGGPQPGVRLLLMLLFQDPHPPDALSSELPEGVPGGNSLWRDYGWALGCSR